MIENYLKIAWRNLMKNKGFSFINIIGLTIGLTGFLLIALFVFDELTFDGFHKTQTIFIG
jgi:putative ABC transport system permease protein